MPTPYNTPGWLHLASRAMGDRALRKYLGIHDNYLDYWCKDMAAQAVQIWRLRWICPACNRMRPDHAEGCEVVKQLGRI